MNTKKRYRSNSSESDSMKNFIDNDYEYGSDSNSDLNSDSNSMKNFIDNDYEYGLDSNSDLNSDSNSMKNFIDNDYEYGSDSNSDLNSDSDSIKNLMNNDLLYNENEKLMKHIFEIKNNWFPMYYSCEVKLRETNCIYLTLSIYHNIITNSFIFNKNIISSYNIPNSTLGIVFKVGKSDSINSTVYKRLTDELSQKSCIFTVPILIMKCTNATYHESMILEKFKDKQLNIIIFNVHPIKHRELFIPDDEIKGLILSYGEENGCEPIYNINPKKNENWYTVIPKDVEDRIREIFPIQELFILDETDNLNADKSKLIKQYY